MRAVDDVWAYAERHDDEFELVVRKADGRSDDVVSRSVHARIVDGWTNPGGGTTEVVWIVHPR